MHNRVHSVCNITVSLCQEYDILSVQLTLLSIFKNSRQMYVRFELLGLLTFDKILMI